MQRNKDSCIFCEKDIKDLSNKAEEVTDILEGMPYFESIMVLEMVREALRLTWLNEVARESKGAVGK